MKQRQHIAQQLEDTYLKEQQTQRTRIEAEKARAMADQQPNLVRAELSVKIAELDKQVAQKRGEGEKLRLLEVTEGQKYQAQVLGKDQALQLAILTGIGDQYFELWSTTRGAQPASRSHSLHQP